MSTQVKARRVARGPQSAYRTFWLAGIGAVSLARKKLLRGTALATAKANAMRHEVEAMAGQVADVADRRLGALRRQVTARLAPVASRSGRKARSPARNAGARRRRNP